MRNGEASQQLVFVKGTITSVVLAVDEQLTTSGIVDCDKGTEILKTDEPALFQKTNISKYPFWHGNFRLKTWLTQ